MSKRRAWVKLWCDALDSRKLARVGDSGELLFYRLLMLAGERGGTGTITEGRVEDIAWRFRIEQTEAEAGLTALVNSGLIEWNGEEIRLVSWDDRQSADTQAERAARYRVTKASRDRHATVTDESRDRHARHALEKNREEKRREEHIQPCPVREEPKPEPAKAARVSVPVSNPPRTDAELRPLFDAYCTGTGQRLTWRHQYVLPCEQIAVLTRDAAVVQRAARFYAERLGIGITPSLARFASEFDKWRAESERPAREATKQRRDDPRFGAPSPAAKRLWCSRCMTTHPEGQHVALATA